MWPVCLITTISNSFSWNAELLFLSRSHPMLQLLGKLLGSPTQARKMELCFGCQKASSGKGHKFKPLLLYGMRRDDSWWGGHHKSTQEHQPHGTAATLSYGLRYWECANDTEQALSLPQTRCREHQPTSGSLPSPLLPGSSRGGESGPVTRISHSTSVYPLYGSPL